MSFEEDYKLLIESEESKLRKLVIEVASNEDSRIKNYNSVTGVIYAFIIKELTKHGRMKHITRQYIENATGGKKTIVNNVINDMIKKGYVKRYKKVKKYGTTRDGVQKYVYDKYEFTLLITERLINGITNVGEKILFKNSDLEKFYTEAISEEEKINAYQRIKNGIVINEEITTKVDGRRYKVTNIDKNSVISAKEALTEQYKRDLKKIDNIANTDGMIEELEPVKPLVSDEELKFANLSPAKKETINELKLWEEEVNSYEE